METAICCPSSKEADTSDVALTKDDITRKKIAESCKIILDSLGEQVDREGLLDTPNRYAKAMQFLAKGYTESVDSVVNKALFTSESKGMVVVKDIDFFSMCEHHMLPFYGKAHVAYLPSGRVLGLSKFARVVDVYARRFQIQEQLNEQIAGALEKILRPRGVIVVLEASHMCMSMRGVQRQNSKTMTLVSRGELSGERIEANVMRKFFNSSIS